MNDYIRKDHTMVVFLVTKIVDISFAHSKDKEGRQDQEIILQKRNCAFPFCSEHTYNDDIDYKGEDQSDDLSGVCDCCASKILNHTEVDCLIGVRQKTGYSRWKRNRLVLPRP